MINNKSEKHESEAETKITKGGEREKKLKREEEAEDKHVRAEREINE